MIQAPGDYPRVVPSRDKHSSLLQTVANYDRKIFIALGLGCTVVEYSTHNTKIVGLNPFSANVRCEMVNNNLHSGKREGVLYQMKHFHISSSL